MTKTIAKATRKAATKKSATVKANTSKPAVKKAVAKKTAVKKAAPAKTVAKKAPAKKAVVKKAAPKKVIAKKAAPKKAAPKKAAPKKAIAKKAAPIKAAAKKPARRAPAKAAISELTQIKGIGAKFAAQLTGAGVKSIADLAKLKKADIQKIDAATKLGKRINGGNWVALAKQLVRKTAKGRK